MYNLCANICMPSVCSCDTVKLCFVIRDARRYETRLELQEPHILGFCIRNWGALKYTHAWRISPLLTEVSSASVYVVHNRRRSHHF